MATRRPDPDALAAIRAHWAKWHLASISEEEIGFAGPGRVAKGIKVSLTPDTRESPAWFTCFACPEGARRYRTDVGADPTDPPKRHIDAIRAHFVTAHGVRGLPAERIYGGSSLPALATYGPSTPLVGAHLICELCPRGNNRIYIEDPPYGDARSFGQLRMHYPHLAGEVAGLDPVACAKRMEAHHRGVVIPAATQPAVERALKKAQKGSPTPRISETQVGIQTVLLEGVRSGARVTDLIAELAALAQQDRAAYAVRIADAMPAMQPYMWHPPERLAELLTRFCGIPATSQRALWSIWNRIPEDVRRAAQESQADDAEPSALH